MYLKFLNKKLILIALLLGISLLKLFITLKFNNSDWEPDSFMHFLELKTIFTNIPNNLALGLGVWTKPLYAYSLGFIVGIFNIRNLIWIQLINILISILISYFTYKIVLKLFNNFKIAVLSILLTSLSLTLFKSSTSVLTDQVFSLMLILGTYFTLEKKFNLASLFFGLSILGRIEGVYFIVLYNLHLFLKLRNSYLKVLKEWLITIIPVFIWNLLGFLNTGLVLYVIQAGYPSTSGAYGYGGWLSYPKLFLVHEFILTTLFLIGTTFLFINLYKSFNKRFAKQELFNYLFYIFINFFGFFVIQLLFWKAGIFGSAGLMRYFVSVLPFMIIISCYGVLNIISTWKGGLQNAILFLIVILQISLLIFHLNGIIFSKTFPEENLNFKLAGEWIKNNVSKDKFVYSDRPEVLYYAERDLTNSANRFGAEWNNHLPGIYVWSKDWGESIFHLYPSDFNNSLILYRINDELYIIQI